MKKKRIQGWLAASVMATAFWSGSPVYADSIGDETEITPYQPSATTAGIDVTDQYAVWINGKESDKAIILYDIANKRETKIAANSSEKKSVRIDGDTIAWIDERNKQKDIYVYDIKNKQEKRITTDAVAEELEIQGTKIVWTDKRGGKSNIYAYDLSTNTDRKVSTGDRSTYPTVYGTIVAWQDERHGNSEIYMYNLQTNEETRVTNNSSNQRKPAIYDNVIVYEDYRGGERDIYQYDISKKKESQVIDDSAKQERPQVYDDFMIYEESNDLLIYDLDDEDTEEITGSLHSTIKPAISKKYVLYTVEETDEDDEEVARVYLYDIKKDKSEKLGGVIKDPSQPSGSDEYAIYLNDEDVVLLNIDTKATKVISSSDHEPARPLVSDTWAVYLDEEDDRLIAYSIKNGTSKAVTSTKSNPVKELYEIEGNQLLWVDEDHGDYIINLTNLSTGKTEELEDLNSEPEAVDISRTHALWVTDKGSDNSQVYVYDLKKGSANDVNRGRTEIKGGALGDDFAVWSEISEYDDWDIFYYDFDDEKVRSLSKDYDQINPKASRDVIVYQDNSRISDTHYEYLVYNLVEADNIASIDSKEVKDDTLGIGGNRIVWVDNDDKLFTLVFGDRQPNEEEPDPGQTEYDQYTFYQLIKENKFKQIVDDHDFEDIVFVFYAGTAEEKKYNLKEITKDSKGAIALINKVGLKQVLVRVYN